MEEPVSRRPFLTLLVAAVLLAACSGTNSGGPKPSATPGGTPAAGARATIETPLGNIVIQLTPGTGPIAAANFVKLAQSGAYDGVVFQRLVPGFVIQGGDVQYGHANALDTSRLGLGGPGYTIKDDPVVGDYVRGAVAMARTTEPDSAGSQFFICLADLTGSLDKAGGYVIFGQVVSGMDVVDVIAAEPNSGPPDNRALTPVPMTHVTISPP
jgi:peptidyl-prolyl cis-trans isomerase B (cyclophilin B)